MIFYGSSYTPNAGAALNPTINYLTKDVNLNSVMTAEINSPARMLINSEPGIWSPIWPITYANAAQQYFWHSPVNDNRFNATFADGHAEFLRVFVGVNATNTYNVQSGFVAGDGRGVGRVTDGQQRIPAKAQSTTSVPTFSPSTTRLMLCGLKRSNTMIGILLSMHSENAAESITLSCFCNASM